MYRTVDSTTVSHSKPRRNGFRDVLQEERPDDDRWIVCLTGRQGQDQVCLGMSMWLQSKQSQETLRKCNSAAAGFQRKKTLAGQCGLFQERTDPVPSKGNRQVRRRARLAELTGRQKGSPLDSEFGQRSMSRIKIILGGSRVSDGSQASVEKMQEGRRRTQESKRERAACPGE